jgi:hypothetical protein
MTAAQRMGRMAMTMHDGPRSDQPKWLIWDRINQNGWIEVNLTKMVEFSPMKPKWLILAKFNPAG